jgi:hypothetical protein
VQLPGSGASFFIRKLLQFFLVGIVGFIRDAVAFVVKVVDN